MRKSERDAGAFPRALSILSNSAAVLAAVAVIVLLVVGIPAVAHVLTGVAFLCIGVAASAWARRRERHGLALVFASASLSPLIFSQWSTRVLGSSLLSDLSLPLYVAIVNTCVALLLSVAARLTRVPLFAPASTVAASVALFGIGAAFFPTAALESQLWSGAILVAYGGAAWPWLIGSLAARIAARSIAAIAGVAALLLAAATWPSTVWGTSAAFLLTAGVFALSLFFSPVAVTTGTSPDTKPLRVLVPTREPAVLRELGAWKTGAALGLGLALAGIAAAPAVHFPSLALQLDITGILTALLSSVLAVSSWRVRHKRSAPGLRISGLVTLAVSAITVIPTLGITTIELWNRIAAPNFSVDAFALHALVYPEMSPFSWVGAAALTGATTVMLIYAGTLRRFSWLPLALGGLTVLTIVSTLR